MAQADIWASLLLACSAPPAQALHSWTGSQGPVCQGAGPRAPIQTHPPFHKQASSSSSLPGLLKGPALLRGPEEERGEEGGVGEESKKGPLGEGRPSGPGEHRQRVCRLRRGLGQRNRITKNSCHVL